MQEITKNKRTYIIMEPKPCCGMLFLCYVSQGRIDWKHYNASYEHL